MTVTPLPHDEGDERKAQEQVEAAKPKPNLAQRLAAAAAAIPEIPKKGQNTQQGYAYVQEEDIVAACKDALLANGGDIAATGVLGAIGRPRRQYKRACRLALGFLTLDGTLIDYRVCLSPHSSASSRG